MRIRSIKPEFWRSDDIASLPISARLLFVGLWSYVDDNGVGSDKLASIAADLFAPDLEADPTETFRRVSVDTACLHERGLIVRYRDGHKPLLYITNWEKHQVVKNPSLGHKYPLPSANLRDSSPGLRRPYVDPTQTLGTGTGEQGNRGTGEQGTDITQVSPVTYVPERASESNSDLDEIALEVGVDDIDDLRKVLSGTLGHSIGGQEALVFAQEIGKLATDPVFNLTAYVVTACQTNPDQIRQWYQLADLGVTA